MNPPNRRSVLKTIGTGAAALVAGVGTSAAGSRETKDDEAMVRVAHASPDAPAVDVYVDESPDDAEPTIEDVEFTDVTEYLTIPEGEHEVVITAADSPDPVSPTPLTVELGHNPYTFAAIGELSPEDGESDFTVDVYKDNLNPLDAETGRVRAYHAVPDAPAVDVRVEDGPTLASGLEFGMESQSADVPADTYPVAVYPAGEHEPVFGPVDVEVREGQALTAFAMGNLDPEDDEPGFELVPVYEDVVPFGEAKGKGEEMSNGDDGEGKGKSESGGNGDH